MTEEIELRKLDAVELKMVDKCDDRIYRPRMEITEKRTALDKARIFAIASSILLRHQHNRLTRVPIDHLTEMPAISGIYMIEASTALDPDDVLLYIGMSKNLAQRCNLVDHHKMPLAIEADANNVLVAWVNPEDCWHVEQILIDRLRPKLNERCDTWWKYR